MSTQEERELEQILERVDKTREAITADLKARGAWKRGTDRHGKVDCPVCGGHLLYRESGYNGRIRAQCVSRGCVSFME